jgi:hypothetical protein
VLHQTSPRTWLRLQVKDGKKAKFQLGVAEPKLGSAIQETTSVPCVCNEFIGELLRGIRAHFTRFIDNLKDEGERRGLGLLGLLHFRSARMVANTPATCKQVKGRALRGLAVQCSADLCGQNAY